MKQHSSRFLALVNDAKTQIHEISPQTLKEWINSKKSFHLIDVRDESELSSGLIPNAIHLSKGVIERDIEKKISDVKAPIVVYCSGGFRAALVALNLQKMGYEQVFSLNTGSSGWQEAGFSLEK